MVIAKETSQNVRTILSHFNTNLMEVFHEKKSSFRKSINFNQSS